MFYILNNCNIIMYLYSITVIILFIYKLYAHISKLFTHIIIEIIDICNIRKYYKCTPA